MNLKTLSMGGKTQLVYATGDMVLNMGRTTIIPKILGWGRRGDGEPGSISWWPKTMLSAGRTEQTPYGTFEIMPLSKSSPLYISNPQVTAIETGVTPMTSKVGTNSSCFFLESSINQNFLSPTAIKISESSSTGGRQLATLQSVLYGDIRKLTPGVDYSEELKSADNLTKGWVWNSLPTLNNYANMDLVTGPYSLLHNDNPSNFYSITGTANSNCYFMHKVVLENISEDALRIYLRGSTNRISGRETRNKLYILNLSDSTWENLADISMDRDTQVVSMLDISKNNKYVQNGEIYFLCYAQGSNNNDDVVTSYYRNFDLWAGYLNPQDI